MCGLIANPKCPQFGCSPDRVTKNMNLIKVNVHVKTVTTEEACKDKKFVTYLEN